MNDGGAAHTAWTDALLAAALFVTDPATGGICVRALPGPVRDRFLAALRRMLPPGAPLRRMPLHIGDDRLLGALDLPATLRAGVPVAARGLLAEAHGGVVLLAMAERVSAATAARICHALDHGEVTAERDGVALRSPASIGVVALDEGAQPDEQPPGALLDRLAFLVDLTPICLGETKTPEAPLADIAKTRAGLPAIELPDDALASMCATAAALGVGSTRAVLLAVRAARAAAALAGRQAVTEADAIIAARLVLAPRATRLPEQDTAPPEQSQQAEPPPRDGDDAAPSQTGRMEDIVLAAAQAAIPAGLLAQLLAGKAARRATTHSGAGVAAQASLRGRPMGARAGKLRHGARLNLIETLRAAAPWQKLRQRNVPAHSRRIMVTPDDFRITRFRERTESVTIFVVDASGSAAAARLAEAKGAVELVLADCYVRRDRVALIAFRGTGAELLLPPTSSLLRAKRSLAGLPGGGGTPLAAGLDAAALLADGVRRKGQSPAVILLSDGRANIARDGKPGRTGAETDALGAGRALRAAGVPCIVVDTSARPSPDARRLADEMAARYVPLPYADAAAVARAVRA